MKKIRSNFVKESLMDYANLAQTLKENSSNIVKDLLKDTMLDKYTTLLSEEDEKEYEEVEDTDSETTNDANDDAEKTEEVLADDEESDGDAELEGEEPTEEAMPDANDEWAEFDNYKVDGTDDEYDFSEANDEDVVKVYKLLNDDDQVLVNVDHSANKVELKDNETGAEYLIDLGVNEESEAEEDMDMDVEGDLDYDNESMNESNFYEIVLNEYDSHVGYTDNYQKKDVMSTPEMEEPGKNVNDWDAGVPKSKSKPWAGSTKGKGQPFNEEEEMWEYEIIDENEEELQESQEDMLNVAMTAANKGQKQTSAALGEESELEEATNVGGFVQQNSTSKSHVPNSKGRKARNSSVAGVKTKGTADPRYSTKMEESKTMAKMNKILKENAALKKALVEFKKTLQEAAVLNVNLGQIVKLISENSTTTEEKKEIIARFGKDAKTVQESKALYEAISNELKKKQTMNINEDKQFTAAPNKMINETPIYVSNATMKALDLMSRICK